MTRKQEWIEFKIDQIENNDFDPADGYDFALALLDERELLLNIYREALNVTWMGDPLDALEHSVKTYGEKYDDGT